MTVTHAGRRSPWASVAISFILVGMALRLVSYLSEGQLYVDDARLALNIATRSLGQLMRPLDYSQVTPIPFLWIERLAIRLGGVNEYALRTPPLLASLVVLALLWSVGRRALGERPAAVATCLGALSSFLIDFSGSVKQYGTDALVTMLLIPLVLDVLDGGDDAAWGRLAAGGAAAEWISQPAVFVLAGAALALPASTAVRSAPRWVRRYGLTAIVWASAFAVIYFFFYRMPERDPYLKSFWDWTFLTPGMRDLGGRVWRAARAILVPPLAWPSGMLLGTPLVLGGLTTTGFLVGLAAIRRSRGASLALLCGGPYAAALGAAAVGKYPMAGRFLLFAAPLALFVYASAVCWAADAMPPRARTPALATAVGLLTLLLYPPALEEASHPMRRRETKVVLDTMDARAPDAPVYLFSSAQWHDGSVWVFNTTDWRAPDTARLRRFGEIWNAGIAARFAGAPPADVAAISSRVRGREELIGVGARIQYVAEGIARSPEPASAWVESESERIRRAAHPTAWVWANELYPESAIADLLRGIRLRGGRLIFAQRMLGATAWEVRFPEELRPR